MRKRFLTCSERVLRVQGIRIKPETMLKSARTGSALLACRAMTSTLCWPLDVFDKTIRILRRSAQIFRLKSHIITREANLVDPSEFTHFSRDGCVSWISYVEVTSSTLSSASLTFISRRRNRVLFRRFGVHGTESAAK